MERCVPSVDGVLTTQNWLVMGDAIAKSLDGLKARMHV